MTDFVSATKPLLLGSCAVTVEPTKIIGPTTSTPLHSS